MVNSTLSFKKSAQFIGILYLLHTIAIVYGVFYVSSQIGISGTDEMAKNMISHSFLFRSGIICRLISVIPTILLAITLYKLLKSINDFQANVMFFWVIMSVPFQFIGEVFNITSIMIANGEVLKSVNQEQQQDFISLCHNIYNNINSISQVFWGLWLFPLGILIYKSNFIPRIFGIILLVGGMGYLIDYIAFLCSPSLRSITVLGLLLGFISEIVVMLWFLYRGFITQTE